jgi:hypothetical protein
VVDAPADTDDDARDAPDDDAPTASPAMPLVEPVVQTAPTVGGDPMVHVQPMAESAGARTPGPSPGTAGLPLAPSTDAGGALTPPVTRATGSEVQRLPEASAATTSRPLVSPASPSTSSSSAPSVQRSVGSTPSTSTGTGTLPFVRPVGGRSIGADSSSPMAMLSAPAASGAAASMPVQLRRLGVDDRVDAVTSTSGSESATGGGAGAAAMPLAPIQRLDAGTSASASSANGGSAGRPATSDLPLHTPAASIPTAADVAIRAGLAERGPDGTLLYTAAPATTSFVVQRHAEDDDPGSDYGDLSVQTLPEIGAHRARATSSAAPAGAAGGAPSGGGGGGGEGAKDAAADAKDLSAEAKKLYPYIRSALEADIRRQIEGKSRASRFRP